MAALTPTTTPDTPPVPDGRTTPVRLWLLIFFAVLFWSGWHPYDRYIWVLEAAPAIFGLLLIALTRRRFPLTPLVYWLILAHAIILMVGSKYTYARVPLFDWLKDVLELGRNHYDKVGHLVQGFVPALIAREILLRLSPLRRGGWLFFLVTTVCLAFSAFYELIEWWVAELSGTAATAFLGTQGYAWDTQSDMLLALIGAILGQLLLARCQDRQLGLEPPRQPATKTDGRTGPDAGVLIRRAGPDDWQAVVAIYNQAVEEQFCTADTEPASVESRRLWLETHLDRRYPILLAEADGRVLGWCSLSPWRPGRRALAGVAEVSYYLDRSARGRGLASRLLTEAMRQARNLEFHTLIAILMDVNQPSQRLLEKHGFEPWGQLPQVAVWPDGSRCGQLIYGRRLSPDS
ncbi:putative membrane protein YjdF [Geothermobacter ehrlichii]|uniref:Putative membrane protein YjdF n=1 Tax=Geothermobacter ehrlichii TaxID=213224 RepID=A0A5D3WK18_9BACT|nr:GNAT family N-acetyltransferase [Geothermobacter ehrlichii]TYO98694.1 putative membrane protein YjdF [Geothermobacter ehrlichii]